MDGHYCDGIALRHLRQESAISRVADLGKTKS